MLKILFVLTSETLCRGVWVEVVAHWLRLCASTKKVVCLNPSMAKLPWLTLKQKKKHN